MSLKAEVESRKAKVKLKTVLERLNTAVGPLYPFDLRLSTFAFSVCAEH